MFAKTLALSALAAVASAQVGTKVEKDFAELSQDYPEYAALLGNYPEYQFEAYKVTSNDGYISTLFRLRHLPPADAAEFIPGRQPVLLQNGANSNITSWLFEPKVTTNKAVMQGMEFELVTDLYDGTWKAKIDWGLTNFPNQTKGYLASDDSI